MINIMEHPLWHIIWYFVPIFDQFCINITISSVAEIQILISKSLLQQEISSVSFVNMDGDWLQTLIVEIFAGVAVHQSHQELRLPGRKQGPKI